ncbi:MAG: C10 family peptidase, partial [Muribaculaceae bacterium]|nr:C10 family peptidase [Muribaculaceae bacterium]
QGLQAVTPLMSTTWNQYEPYNDMCPTYDGERAITGCVATAMAQVMKKHRWPASGTGELSYVSNGVGVSSDFSSHVYDWDNMLDDYFDEYYQPVGTSAQRNAVAQLMFDCGVAARMVYSPSGSSATSMDAAKGMLNYFNYDKSMQYLMRDWYTDDDWMRLMHSQISQGLPVIYGGDSNEGYGHEFVLDGYDGDGYFHFNWGWGGWDDGYFSLSFDAPAGEDIGYVNYQEALVNICPDKGSSYAPLIVLGGSLLTNASQYDAQSGYVSFTTNGQYGGFYSYALSDVEYEFGVKNTLDDKVISLGSSQLPTFYGIMSLEAASSYFPVGEYDVYMVCKSADTDWTPMRYYVNSCAGKLHFVNDGTTITVGEAASDVVATGIALNSVEQQLTEGDTFTLVATVSPENATDKTVTWSTSDASVAAVDSEGKVTAIAPGTATITATCGSVSAACAVTVIADIKKANQVAYEEVIKEIEGVKAEFAATVAQLKEENPDYDFSEWNEIIGGALEMAGTGAAQALAAANEDG